jgi:ribosome-associated protein
MTDQLATLPLRGDYITLAQAVKVVGLAGTGGQAKVIIREGGLRVNGEPESRPGRKLRVGDRFGTPEGQEWTVTS